MGTTLPIHFIKLLKVINPPDHRLRVAQEIPGQVRDYLENQTDLATVTPHSRLGGSYARDTAVGDIKDVDIFAFLKAEYAEWEPGKILRALGGVLQGLPDALGFQGRIDIQTGQRRSIHVYFEDSDFHLDVVPTVPIDGMKKPLLVPDKKAGKWISSDPLGYQDALSELNGENDGKVVPLMKLHKHWRDVHMQRRRPKSYWLECLVYREIQIGKVKTADLSYAELYRALLDGIYSRFEAMFTEGQGVPQIPDPQLETNVAPGWEREEFEAYMRRLSESRRWVARALEAERDEAIELWKKVFGEEYFPTSVDEEAEKIGTAAKSGSAFVIPTGIVLPVAPESGKAVRSQEHRFYGRAPEEQ